MRGKYEGSEGKYEGSEDEGSETLTTTLITTPH